MIRHWPPLVLALLLFGAPGTYAEPESPSESEPNPNDMPLRVGISPFPPFVIPGEPPKGYSIDLWKNVAAKLGRPYTFVMLQGVGEKLEYLDHGDIDVAIGGLTVTPEREVRFDFTHPSFQSGLAILLPGVQAEPTLWERLVYALGRTKSTVVVAFFFLVVIAGHLVWYVERGKNAFDDHYWPGVFEGIYWAVVTASTVGYGDKAPVRSAGRVLAMLVIVISLPMFAYFTAELASAFTVIDTRARITGPDDLRGRVVGVIRGTASASYAARIGLDIRQWDAADDAYSALESGRVKAVIYDAPSLRYYAQSEGLGKVHVAGPEFEIKNLAMAVRAQSPLREEINRTLLELIDLGTLTELKVMWLGSR